MMLSGSDSLMYASSDLTSRLRASSRRSLALHVGAKSAVGRAEVVKDRPDRRPAFVGDLVDPPVDQVRVHEPQQLGLALPAGLARPVEGNERVPRPPGPV